MNIIEEEEVKGKLENLMWNIIFIALWFIPVIMALYFIHPYLVIGGLAVDITLITIACIIDSKQHKLRDTEPF